MYVFICIIIILNTGVPDPWATDQYQSVACQELDHTAGSEQWMSKESSVCIYSPPPIAGITA